MVKTIGVVAPSCPLTRAAADQALAAAAQRGLTLTIHPQCFLSSGHFAGSDADRRDAAVATLNDPAIDALWLARGGYGANRIAADIVARLSPAALAKPVVGYSDGGFLLSALHRAGGTAVHGPMVQDGSRPGGDSAQARVLDWLRGAGDEAVEPSLSGPTMAFNLTVLSMMMGTAIEPLLDGCALLIEDLSEEEYRIDRTMFHLSGQAAMRGLAGLRVGRFSDIKLNDPDFGERPAAIIAYWCKRMGIAFDPRPADIGHDADNRLVPFARAVHRG